MAEDACSVHATPVATTAFFAGCFGCIETQCLASFAHAPCSSFKTTFKFGLTAAAAAACCCQELLLLLDEYWARHPQLQGIPIYQASGVARKALNVFATYVAMMNADIQKAINQVRQGLKIGIARERSSI